MQVAVEQLQEGLIIVVALQVAASLFLDRGQLKFRQKSMLGRAGIEPIIWPGPATFFCYYVLMFGWFSIRALADLTGRTDIARDSSAVFWKIFLLALFCVATIILVAYTRFESRARVLEEFRVSRGRFLAAVDELIKKTRFFILLPKPVYVLPDNEFDKLYTRVGLGIVLPRGLLDQLSRREIDSLVARQLSEQSGSLYFPTIWILLVINVGVVLLVQGNHIVLLEAFLVYLSFLVAEFLVLNRLLPRLFFQANFRAIQLTGDPESFFSALGGLSRFTGVPLQEPMLQKIGQKAGVSPDRIKELLAEHETKAEDRYPTSGSYMDTGL